MLSVDFLIAEYHQKMELSVHIKELEGYKIDFPLDGFVPSTACDFSVDADADALDCDRRATGLFDCYHVNFSLRITIRSSTFQYCSVRIQNQRYSTSTPLHFKTQWRSIKLEEHQRARLTLHLPPPHPKAPH